MKQSSSAAPNHRPSWKSSLGSRRPTTNAAAVRIWMATVAGTSRKSASICACRTAFPIRSRGVSSENKSEHRSRLLPVRRMPRDVDSSPATNARPAYPPKDPAGSDIVKRLRRKNEFPALLSIIEPAIDQIVVIALQLALQVADFEVPGSD